MMTATDRARFDAKWKLDEVTGCHIWTAAHDRFGYGFFWLKGKNRRAHRVAYEDANGPVPDGLDVLHNCPGGDNTACVNPGHHWVGTDVDNLADRDAKGRTATGDRNGARVHPETRARGGANGAYTKPERRPSGARNGSVTRPERRPRGDGHYNAKLTADGVVAMRMNYARGVSIAALAASMGIGRSHAHSVVTRRCWRHV